MKNILTVITIFIFSAVLQAAEKEYLFVNADGDVDAKQLRVFVKNVEPYIRQYPPRFKSKEHQNVITSDTKNALQELAKVDISKIKNVDLLVDIAFLYAMAHNLDLDTGPHAKRVFEQALAIKPNSKKANYLFGMFLVSTKKYHFDSEIYLKKALESGEHHALYTLALLQLQKGNKEKSLGMLENYLRKYPGNEHVKNVINAVKSGKLKFNRSDGN